MTEQISGNLHISNNVLASIVGNAAQECYGVVGMVSPQDTRGIARLLPTSSLNRGVEIRNIEGKLMVDVYVVVEGGINIATVSENLSETVRFALSNYAQVEADEVNVHVSDIKVR